MHERFNKEMEIKDHIVRDLRQEIRSLKDELAMAKTILKDPKLSQLATRRFGDVIDTESDNKFALGNALVSDLLE